MRFLFCILLSMSVSISFAHELTPQEALSNALQRLNSGVSAAKVGQITNSAVDTDKEKNAVIYDLSGRRIKDMQKGGIYIINGKKVIR